MALTQCWRYIDTTGREGGREGAGWREDVDGQNNKQDNAVERYIL